MHMQTLEPVIDAAMKKLHKSRLAFEMSRSEDDRRHSFEATPIVSQFEKNGYLMKKGQKRIEWKVRWVMIRDKTLFVYKKWKV